MAEAVVGALTYRFRADTNDLRRGMSEAQTQLRSMASQARAASEEMRRGMEESARAVALNRNEMLNLNRQLVDVGVSLTSGQSPFMVLIQQGAQVKDIFDANGSGLRGFAAAIASVFTPARVALAAAATAAAVLGSGAHDAAQKLAEVSEAAKAAGVSVKAVLGAQVMGARVGLDIDGVRAALKKAGDEFENFKRNQGSVKDNLEKLGGNFLSIADKARNAGEFIDKVGGIIRSLPVTEAKQLSQSLFGEDAGRRFFEMVREGKVSMEAFARAAGDAGDKLGPAAEAALRLKREIAETAEKADNELLKAFGDMYDPVAKLALMWQQIKVDIGQAAQAIRKDFAEAGKAVDRVVEAQRELAKPHGDNGETAKSVFSRMRGQSAEEYNRLMGNNRMGRLIAGAGREAPQELQERLKSGSWNPPNVADLFGEDAGSSRQRYAQREEDSKKHAPHAQHHAKATKEARDAIGDYIKSLHEAETLAKADLDTWKLGNVEKAKAEALVKAENVAQKEKRTLSDAQKKEISATAEATARYKEKLKELEDQQRRVNDAMREFADNVAGALEGLIVRGEKAGDILRRLAETLLSSGLRGLLTGEGMFGGLFGLGGKNGEMGGMFGLLGKAFKGFFAEGGNLGAGQWGIAGERGPELITGPATITPAGAFGGGQKVIVNNYAAGVKVTPTVSRGEVHLIVRQALAENNKRSSEAGRRSA